MSEHGGPMEAAPARLLYIDDDPGLCRLIQRGLNRRGWDVACAQDGPTGEAMVAESRFDIVAVDHFMPGQDGLTTLDHIRAQPHAPPVVYVTGADDSRLAVAALKAGAADYVVKTASDDFLDLLSSALEQALNQVRLREERDAVARELQETNTRLEAVVLRQQALLREVNHRVANSLQLVSSLVHMQAAALEEPAAKAALLDTQARISAIMQVHRRLYTSDDVQNVDISEYLRGLVGELEQSLSAGGVARPISLRAAPFSVDTDKAVSLGVMVAELVTNAHKYAYRDGQDGEIRVRFEGGPKGAILVVEDDGCGIDLTARPKGTGLGHRVIEAMARSLKSKVEYDPAHRGARAVLRFDA